MAERPSAVTRLRVGAMLAGIGALLLATGLLSDSPDSGRELRAWLGSAIWSRAAPAGFEEIVERVKPAVFGVTAKVVEGVAEEETLEVEPDGQLEPFDDQQDEQQTDAEEPKRPRLTSSQGSGFFISPDGYAVTTNHVIERGASIEITTDDGKSYPVKLIGVDPDTDLALLKVDGKGKRFPFVEMADDAPRIGEWVIAVGNPFGLGGTVTAGIVSAGTRDIMSESYNDFIQIDAPVNQGNSGGPTFDVGGKVIGVNSAIFSPTGGSVGIGFAIPAGTVKSIVAALKDKGVVTRGWIGVQIQSVTPEIADSLNLKEARGALVAETESGGPAAKAGILSGDVIISLDGKKVKADREFANAIGDLAPGTRVKLGLIRKGENKTVAATLVQQPGARKPPAVAARGEPPVGQSDPASLGLSLAPGENLSPTAEGVVVTDVDPGGIAAERGLQAGDIILEVGGSAVKLPADVKKALNDARNGKRRNVLARVKSSDSTHFVAIPVG
jgi:serine protease Do